MGIFPAILINVSCNSSPSFSSLTASENPDAKQTAPPQLAFESCEMISIVATLLTPTKAASIGTGNSSIFPYVSQPQNIFSDGCTANIFPLNPIFFNWKTIDFPQTPPPITNTFLGLRNLSKLLILNFFTTYIITVL